MRLTHRGWAAVLVVTGSIAMGWQYGPRALNAVVTPLVVVLAAGVLTIALADRPRVRRSGVAEGFVGETRTVETTIETERAVSATVRDAVGDGLTATDPVAVTTLDGESEFSYEIRLEERGDHPVGPLTIGIVDLFGLVERRFEYEGTASVLVYPPIHDLRGGAGRDLHLLADVATRPDREEFDHLREYERGDSLRDVHWKSAAKRPDEELVVTEYVENDAAGSAIVAAECTPTRIDDLATAVASVATYLLQTGVDVGVTLPTGARPPGSGQQHHYDLLGLLAVVEAGELDEGTRATADVLVQADANGTRVILDDHTIPFDRLRGRDGGDESREERVRSEPADRSGAEEGPSSGVTA
ncbi:DUF58 domain-containing protein [Halosolutus amylolyticus]|uniref:DUF58 domain-containing protein n=1 Tax=Halosolutus amylolyticus TaxID=2932267 RepID=A0ABD5PPG3_9EURY|nr:DUF58 domain-containing protein [Halosolutus amylolyticus]